MWLRIGIAATVIVASGLLAVTWVRSEDDLPSDLTACLDEAKKANAANDIERERRLLEHAGSLRGEAEDAAEIERRLAALEWKFHARFDAARERLLAASAGAEPAEAWLALARLEQARESFAAAREAAQKAAETAETDRERRRAGIAAAEATVAEAVAHRRAGEVADSAELAGAFAHLHDLVRREAGVLEPSRLLLRAALLRDRGDAALLAWRSYFHAAPGQPVANAVAGAGAVLEQLLPGWQGPEAADAERIELAAALAASRFFTEAALVALDRQAGDAVRDDPRVAAAVAYAAAIDRVRRLTEEYYRQTALGRGDASRHKKEVWAELTAVVEEIEGEAPTSNEAVRRYLDERFGAYVSLGKTAGYHDLHMGHRVIDETRTVEQYGQRAELRFVSLDNMVSNGFQSWAWEGDSEHGGWARPNTIYQVRSAYAGRPLEVWRALHSADERREFEEEMERQSARDDSRARKDPHAFLPGMAMRLKLQGFTRLLERLQAQGLEGEELRLRYLAELERAVQESSIFAHEGRHAIDKRAGKSSSRKLEFTAKLSEVAFAPEPRIALSGILDANIGDSSPHGQANLEVTKGLVAWMKEHRGEIAGLDSERPFLPQFDLLTDDQIRAAFRSMDPLAKRR